MYLGAKRHVFLAWSEKNQIHGADRGHVGTTRGKLELFGEGARGSCHHGLRSFFPCLFSGAVRAYCTGRNSEIRHCPCRCSEQHCVSSSIIFCHQSPTFKRILELKEATKECTSWKVRILNVKLLALPIHLQVHALFLIVGRVERDPISLHFHGTTGGSFNKHSTLGLLVQPVINKKGIANCDLSGSLSNGCDMLSYDIMGQVDKD